MNDRLHRTDTLGSCKTVICGKQKMHWIEFQLLDEQGEPLANLPYRALNEATRVDFIAQYTGRTDASGMIRLDDLHPLAITLLIDAESLAEQLQTRRLRAERAEPACLLPDTGARNIDSLLNQQILPVLSQQLLQRQAAKHKTLGVSLGYSDEEGITLQFTDAQDASSSTATEARA